MKKILLFFAALVLLLYSCQSNPSYDKKNLEAYFRTRKIEVNKISDKLIITVTDSGIEQEVKRVWSTFEGVCAVGALSSLSEIQQKGLKVDSVLISLKSSNGVERYGYSLRDLREISVALNTCNTFTKMITEEKYDSAKALLGDEILTQFSDPAQLTEQLSKIFIHDKVVQRILIGFKIENQLAALYLNVYYEKEKPRTYVYSFRMEGDGKIMGIRNP